MILTNGKAPLQPGDRVLFDQKHSGTVRYHGKVDFAPKTWVGVELDEERGKNDGSIAGKRYFTCKPGYGIFAHPSRFKKQPDLELGCKVVVKHKYLGIVRFMGTTQFAEGEWVGIELRDAVGKHDGMVRGKRYFSCKPKHGIFTRPTQVTRAVTDTTSSRGGDRQPSSRASPAAGKRAGAPQDTSQSQELKQALDELDALRQENAGLKRQVEDLKQLVAKAEQLSLADRVRDMRPANMADPTEEEIERRSSFSSGDERRASKKAAAASSSLRARASVGAAARRTSEMAKTEAAGHGKAEEEEEDRQRGDQGAAEGEDAGEDGAAAREEGEQHTADTRESVQRQEQVEEEKEKGQAETQPAPKGEVEAGVEDGDKNVFEPVSEAAAEEEAASPTQGASSPPARSEEAAAEGEEEDAELLELLTKKDNDLKYMKRQVAFEQAKVSELAKLLDMAKRSLVEGARRETDLKSQLKTAEQKLEKAFDAIDDLSIHTDALEAELQEALQDKQELSDRLAECQMELLDAKTEQFTAMTECEMMRQDLQELRAHARGDTSVDVEHTHDDKNLAAANDEEEQEDGVPAHAEGETDEALEDAQGEREEWDAEERQMQLEEVADEEEPISGEEGEDEQDAAFLQRPSPPPGVDPNLFCTICEEYGHVAEDCDDTITF